MPAGLDDETPRDHGSDRGAIPHAGDVANGVVMLIVTLYRKVSS